MWYLQADTLVFLLGAALIYALAAAAARRVSPQVRLTPFLLLFDLGVLCFVSPALAAFYIGYTLVTYAFLRILKGVKGPALRRGLFVLFCAACALPFFYARFALLLPALPAVFTLVGFAYNMLKAIDAVFYVYYADKDIPLIAYANFLLFFPCSPRGPSCATGTSSGTTSPPGPSPSRWGRRRPSGSSGACSRRWCWWPCWGRCWRGCWRRGCACR